MIGVDLLQRRDDPFQTGSGHLPQRLPASARGHAENLHHGFYGQRVPGPADDLAERGCFLGFNGDHVKKRPEGIGPFSGFRGVAPVDKGHHFRHCSRGNIGHHGYGARGPDFRIGHNGKGEGVIAGKNDVGIPAALPGPPHVGGITGGFLHAADIIELLRQYGKVFGQQLRPRAPRDHVRNNGQRWERPGNGFDIFLPDFKGAGAVVIGIHQQHRVHAGIGRMSGRKQGFGRVVAADPGNALALAPGSFSGFLNDPGMFFPSQGRTFPGGAHRQNAGYIILNLEINEPFHPVIIDSRVGKRRYNSRKNAGLHNPSSKPYLIMRIFVMPNFCKIFDI